MYEKFLKEVELFLDIRAQRLKGELSEKEHDRLLKDMLSNTKSEKIRKMVLNAPRCPSMPMSQKTHNESDDFSRNGKYEVKDGEVMHYTREGVEVYPLEMFDDVLAFFTERHPLSKDAPSRFPNHQPPRLAYPSAFLTVEFCEGIISDAYFGKNGRG